VADVTGEQLRNELLEMISAPFCKSERFCALYRRWRASLR
jgi:hypothetical protein